MIVLMSLSNLPSSDGLPTDGETAIPPSSSSASEADTPPADGAVCVILSGSLTHTPLIFLRYSRSRLSAILSTLFLMVEGAWEVIKVSSIWEGKALPPAPWVREYEGWMQEDGTRISKER